TRDRRVGRAPIGYLPRPHDGKGCCPCTPNSGCSGRMSSPLMRSRGSRSRGKNAELTDEVGRSAVVVDTGPWIFGRKVVVPAGAIDQIDLNQKKVRVALTKDQTNTPPQFV